MDDAALSRVAEKMIVLEEISKSMKRLGETEKVNLVNTELDFLWEKLDSQFSKKSK